MADESTGKQYLVLDTNHLAHDDLQQECHNLGGFLPEPRNEQENTFLDSLGVDTFVLGMTDRDVEGQWVWESDGSLVSWTRWVQWIASNGGIPQEPDGGAREGCALMMRQTVSHRRGHRPDGWIDFSCPYLRSLPKNLICQRNPGMCTADPPENCHLNCRTETL